MINIPVKDKRKGTTIMESRVEQAAERKMCGYNCAQAVACTYCDLAGIDEESYPGLRGRYRGQHGSYLWSHHWSGQYSGTDQQESPADNAGIPEDHQ